jgi:Flp pilus assembly pilin Flp
MVGNCHAIFGVTIATRNGRQMIASLVIKSALGFLSAEEGVTAIEYALIAGAIGTATAIGASMVGPAVTSSFQSVADAFPS